MPQVIVPGIFNGPDRSGNGGYVCGLMEDAVGESIEVRLRLPPPLDTPMTVAEVESGWELRNGESVVAEARPASLVLKLPDPVSVEAATAAVPGFPGFDFHGASNCFVCGPDREPGQGLRIFPGPVADRDVVAAPWVPTDGDVDSNGVVPVPIVWGVLDCPGAWAAKAFDDYEEEYFPTLGTMSASIDRPIHAGEQLVVVSRLLGVEGRKLHTLVVIYGEDGEVKARARQIEIKVPPDWAT